MKNLFLSICLIFLISTTIVSCKKDHYKVDPPSYIQIDEFYVSDSCYDSQPNRLSLVSHKVTDAWVYLDGALQGAYELPVRFPIIAEGAHKIEVRPGIKQNGISSTRAIYPFYEFYTTDVDLIPEQTTKIEPCLAYLNEGILNGEIEVSWFENFEGVVDLDYNSNTDTILNAVSDEDLVFDGNFSGAVFLADNHSFFEMVSPSLTDLPINGTPIYLELNYRTNHDFFVGLYLRDFSEQINIVGIRQSDGWNKVYIDLSEPIRFNGDSPNFNVFIGFQRDPSIKDVKLFFDNIKLLHF